MMPSCPSGWAEWFHNWADWSRRAKARGLEGGCQETGEREDPDPSWAGQGHGGGGTEGIESGGVRGFTGHEGGGVALKQAWRGGRGCPQRNKEDGRGFRQPWGLRPRFPRNHLWPCFYYVLWPVPPCRVVPWTDDVCRPGSW